MEKQRQELVNYLKDLSENGIQAHDRQLRKDMSSQFSEPDLYAREYVVNAYDAGAKTCYVFGREDKDYLYIPIHF